MELVNFPKRKPMPCPFGGGNAANITDIGMTSSNNVNFYDGFPSVYGAPSASSGKFVTRKEMNAIGNLASNDLFYHKCGGLNTFDPEFALKINGYANGAVLQALVGNDIVYVRSLVDNNMVDFTGSATQAQVNAGIINGGIDGINWVACNTDFSRREFVLFKLPDQIVGAGVQSIQINLTTFQSTATGYVDIVGSATPSIWDSSGTPSYPFLYMYCSESTNGTTWGTPYIFHHVGPGAFSNNPQSSPLRVTRERYYNIYYVVGTSGGTTPPPSGFAYTDVTLRGILSV